MNDLNDERDFLQTMSLAILAVVAVAGVLYLTRTVMIPFVLAIFIASIASPIVDYQVLKLKFPQSVAVGGALIVVLLIVLGFGLLLAYAGDQIVDRASKYFTDVQNQIVKPLQAKLSEWKIDIQQDRIDKTLSELEAYIPTMLKQTFGTTVSLLTLVTLVTIFVIFLLAGRDPHVIRQGIYAEIDQQIRAYISTKLLLSMLTGFLVWISLSMLGLELAAVFGLLAFMLNFIPSIGSIVATMLPIPVAIAQFGTSWDVFLVIALPGAIQLSIGNGLEPKLLGNELKLHPLTILMVLSVWGILWGPIGMLMAVPITAIIRIVLLRFETTRPVANLLAGELPNFDADQATA